MPYLAQTTFSRGELSPELGSRLDLEYFRAGLAECRNFISLKRGGIRRRGGTKFIAEVKTSSDGAYVIPFEFNAEQTYMLEFGDSYFRVYISSGRVGTVEVTTPYAIGEVPDISFVQSADTLYLAHPLYAPRKVERASDTSWSISTLTFEDGPYLDINTTSTALTVNGTGNVVPNMTSLTLPSGTVAGSSDTLNAYLAADGDLGTGWQPADENSTWSYTFDSGTKVVDYYSIRVGPNPIEVPVSWTFEGYNGSSWVVLDTRSEETGWAASETRHYQVITETAYEAFRFVFNGRETGATEYSFTAFRLKESGDTMTAVTVTASSVTGINDGDGFQASDVERMIRIRDADGVWRWMRIVSRSSTTAITADIYGPALSNSSQTITQWALGAWSDVTGWPSQIAFFKDRLGFAATTEQPQEYWFSQTSDFDNHAISSPLVASDAISARILSGRVNKIKWMAESEDLILGTSASIRQVGKATSTDPFGPENIDQKRAVRYGTNTISPLAVGSTILHWGRYGTDLREIVYDFNVNGLISQDLSIISDHLLSSPITAAAYQQYPVSIIWQQRTDGDLVGTTYEREQKVYGFHKHDIGGVIESIATVGTSGYDETWMIVKRTINGATKRYIEILQNPFLNDAQEDAWHLDCASLYDSTATNTVSGLSYLEGETVGIHGDGAYLGTATVTGGVVTLPNSLTASKILIGLPFTSRAKLLRPPVNAQDGASIGRKMRVDEIIVDVYETGSLKAGSDMSADDGTKLVDQIINYEETDNTDAPIPLRTRTIRANIPMRWDADDQLVLEVDDTQPCTVLSVTYSEDGEP